jgi:hypothetical protein
MNCVIRIVESNAYILTIFNKNENLA